MAGYKQPCIHCGALIDSDARVCTACGSMSPFGYACPACLHPVTPGQAVCPGCGRSLYIYCPGCGQETFVGEVCDRCGVSLMVRCKNSRCGALQFFQNEKCTACGKKRKGGRWK